jgi:hypothetical protein
LTAWPDPFEGHPRVMTGQTYRFGIGRAKYQDRSLAVKREEQPNELHPMGFETPYA